ncbi:MAG: family 43 glycosylhydrolase [Clostridiales bacterium]|nr:family 43 glycosylhydrolase [Clostridiales bacterium]
MQILNPFLPLNEYVPDGEAHVFGDRVYLYGSHDAAGSDRFCVRDYTVWSAPVSNLSEWHCHGVTYRKMQDPRSAPGKPADLYAPDCVQGPDGRYYLYYVAMGPNVKNFGPIGVAVSNDPGGPFAYLGDVRYPDGTPVQKYLTNDPAVLNDNGRIWLYYGWGLGRDFRSKLFAPVLNAVQSRLFDRPVSEIRTAKPCILSCAVAELERDMRTVKSPPKAVLDSKTTAPKGSVLYHHAFYEAPSIRKIGGLYYLVYSSGQNNELAYATSRFPDRGFTYRGVIISGSDLGFRRNRTPKWPAGTIHGSIEKVGAQWYVFYHRCTNNTDFSRQACAEPIVIESDGTIRQAELTSCGLNGGALSGRGRYPAAVCCNLIFKRPVRPGLGRQQKKARVTEKDGQTYLAGLTAGTVAGYKYFDLENTRKITLEARGRGVLLVHGRQLAVQSDVFVPYTCAPALKGERALYFKVLSGKVDLLSFTLE